MSAQRDNTLRGLCAEHQRLYDEGFIALIECDPLRSGKPSRADRMKPEQACRTGRIAHLKREAFPAVFNVQLAVDQVCVFVEPEIIGRLQAPAALPSD